MAVCAISRETIEFWNSDVEDDRISNEPQEFSRGGNPVEIMGHLE
jgi:hypothetical protein